MKTALIALAMSVMAGVAVAQGPAQAATPTDQEISDSWIYIFARFLVLRQQQLDFQEGFKWNELVHRKPGAVDWPNPNLDVTYSEAWVAVGREQLHHRDGA